MSFIRLHFKFFNCINVTEIHVSAGFNIFASLDMTHVVNGAEWPGEMTLTRRTHSFNKKKSQKINKYSLHIMKFGIRR